jgi:predicted RNase H-like HicB family nuclease
MAVYIGLVHKDEGSSYGVSFPDFPGCITGGDTLDEAAKEAPDALGFHIRGMMKDGEPIPAPSSLDALMADPDNAGAIAIAVTPNMQGRAKAVRINITINEDLLTEIDTHAGQLGKSRSEFLADAARMVMA